MSDCSDLRGFLRRSGRHLLTLSLAGVLYWREWADDQGMEELHAWFRDYFRVGRHLGTGQLSQEAWQDSMGRLFARCRLAALLEWINFDAVSQRLKHADLKGRGELFHSIAIDGEGPSAAGASEPRSVVITKIAYIKKGGSIPPHGHRNMVSAFLHLSGECRVRQYDKLAEDGGALVIRPRVDYVSRPGQWSSVSDTRDNVHWLTGQSGDCFLFTTKLIELEEGRPIQGRINVDVRRGAYVGGGALRVPKISYERAAEWYGSTA